MDEARRYTEARKKYLEKMYPLIQERFSGLEDGQAQQHAAENVMRTEFRELWDELFEAEAAAGEIRNQADKKQTEYLNEIQKFTGSSWRSDAPVKKEAK